MDNAVRDVRGSLDHLHRVGAVVFGVGLGLFGILGFANGLAFFSTSGKPVLGLSTNGALSLISVIVAAILIAAGIRGGRIASTAARRLRGGTSRLGKCPSASSVTWIPSLETRP